jgi:hypothetical protein
VKAGGNGAGDSCAVVTNSFWDNWFVQAGVDMWLQNPHGKSFKDVFPNGKSFGIDVAAGKWVTPEFGFRGSLNWENGIFKSDHAKWIHEGSKSYMVVAGDILINLTNLLSEYRADRKWQISVYPRAGALLDFRKKGLISSPLLGLGFGTTYRLGDRWSLYGNLSYQVTSSVLGYRSGAGSGSNGYFDISVGAQVDLGQNRFYRPSEPGAPKNRHAVVTNDFWDNWFVQAGLGMALINEYGCNFSHVFPNGNTFGISAGMGKWLTPEYGLRAGVNWQNGLIGNRRLAWLDKKDQPGSNHDAGGFVIAYMDVLLNLHNLFSGYDEHRRWNTIVYPRVGLGHNFDVSDSSPNVGLGVEQTYRLSQRTSLYGNIAYHFISSGFMGKDHESGHYNAASNGFFLIDLGIRYDLGRTGWDRPGENRPAPPMTAGHNWPRFAVNTLASVGVGFALKTALKKMVKEERPDHSDKESFPSGHATMAFAAARSIDKEFRKESIWIPIAGYAAATAIGVERVASDRHHWYDVVTGAGLGIASAELTWWLSDMLFPQRKYGVAIGTSGNTIDVTVGL